MKQQNPTTALLESKQLWVLLALTFAVGLTCAWLHRSDGPATFKGDDIEYHAIATRLVTKGVFPSTYRAPGYPAFVALVYAVAGERPHVIFVLQAALFAASVLLVGLSFTLITRQNRLGLAAAAGTAAFPLFYWKMIAMLLTETLALFLVSLLIWLLLLTLQRPRWRMGLLIGVVFASATLTKAALLPFAAAIIVCILLADPRRRGLACATTFLLTLVVAMTPWTIRNYQITGAIQPVSTGSGLAFWMGNYPGNYGSGMYATNRMVGFPQLPFELRDAVQGLSEVERDRYLKDVAMGYIKEDPSRAAIICLYKFSDLWLGNLGANTGCWAPGRRPLLALGHFAIPAQSLLLVPVFLLAIVGVLATDRLSRRLALPVFLLFFFWTSAYVVLISAGWRYTLPVYPYVLGFAAIAVVAIWDRLVAIVAS